MRTVSVHFSDACTDVLVWLADQPRDRWYTPSGVADGAAPADADDALRSTYSAMRTLHECGLLEGRFIDGDIPMWRATDAGLAAVAEARAKASTIPDHLPDNDESRGHEPVT